MPTSKPQKPEYTALYLAQQVREFDRMAIDQRGIPGISLMKRAGRALFNLSVELWEQNQCTHGAVPAITLFCGGGNNGGDGYIVAGLAAQAGWQVQLISITDIAQLKGDALLAAQFAQQEGVVGQLWGDLLAKGEAQITGDIIVDALLGTGLSREVSGKFLSAIEVINDAKLPVISADIPSGLCGDTGRVFGAAVRASHTISFIGRKRGLYTGKAADLAGELHFDSLAVPDDIYAEQNPAALQILHRPMPKREKSSHKGRHGHVLVVGGNHGMAGAIAMAAQTAARAGAGLVSCATRSEHVNLITSLQPEIMSHAVPTAQDLRQLAQRASVLVIGPGLGKDAWAQDLLAVACELEIPQVWDADALNLLAQFPQLFQMKTSAPRVVTPHPGEAARLLGLTVKEVEADRFAAAGDLQLRLQAAQQLNDQQQENTASSKVSSVVLLKGAGTIIADGQQLYVNSTGSPAMATGGMGDVLSGLIGSLLAQGMSPTLAAQQGAFLHGKSGELAGMAGGERGTLATDLLPYLRHLVNETDYLV